MKQNYPVEFKKKIVRLREEAGRTYPNLTRKGRKKTYYARKEEVKAQIEEIYHEHMGVNGY